MKISSQKRRIRSTKRVQVATPFMVDEYHQLMHTAPLQSMMLNFYPGQRGAAKYVVTQALVKGKRGKVCLIGMTRDAVTGEPFPPLPKKFLPAQVLRRQAQ